MVYNNTMKKLTVKDAEKIQEFVKNSVSLSDGYLEKKKQNIQDRYNNYYKYIKNPATDTDIKDNTIFNVVQMFLAVDQYEGIGVNFEPMGHTEYDKRIATYMGVTAESDNEVGGYKKIRIGASFEQYFSGVAVRVRKSWNKYKEMPEFMCVPTINLIVDPEGDGSFYYDRFFGYKATYQKESMMNTEDGWIPKEVEKLIKKGNIEGDEDVKEVKTRKQNDLGYNSLDDEDKQNQESDSIRKSMGYVNVYDLFCRIQIGDDKRSKIYLITMAQTGNNIIRIKEIKGTTKEERENCFKQPFPIVVNRYLETVSGDPIGRSLFDLLEDKQLNRSALLNLAVEKGIKNLDAIMAIKDNVDIGDVNPGSDKVVTINTSGDPAAAAQPISNFVGLLDKENINMNELIGLVNLLQEDIERTTATNDNLLGIGAEEKTLGQTKSVQSNANIRHRKRLADALDSEKVFWTLWYKSYVENYKVTADSKEGKGKHIVLHKGITNVDFFLDKDMFKQEIPIIKLKSKIISEQDNQEKKISLLSTYQVIATTFAQDPEGKREYDRMLLRASGMEDSDINKIIRKGPLQIQIEQENEMLSKNIEVPALSLSDDIEARFPTQMNITTEAGIKRSMELQRLAFLKQAEIEQSREQEERDIAGSAEGDQGPAGEGAKVEARKEAEQAQKTPKGEKAFSATP